MRNVYLALAGMGLILPYYFFGSFLRLYGFNLQVIYVQLFTNQVVTFFVMDLVIATIVFYIFLYAESRRLSIQNWWLYLLLSLLVGLSFALPLFLYSREKKLQPNTA
jgi:uncharacterized membrane protein